jgi:hypothetical protein
LELRGGPDFPEEPVAADGRAELGPEDLDGDLAAVPEVAGEVDRGHAALADQTLDLVAVAERGAKLFENVGHDLPQVGEDLVR